MSAGAAGLGFAQAAAAYLQSERERNRKAEDAQIDQQMALIHELANRPDANPNLMGQAIHDLIDLGQAKAGQRKLKSGNAGFAGAHELPVSQFLQGLAAGTRPIVGPTQEANPAFVETPWESSTAAMGRLPGAQPAPEAPPQAGAMTPPPAGAPTGGASVLAAPVPIPPSPQSPGVSPSARRLVGAGQGIQTEAVLKPQLPAQPPSGVSKTRPVAPEKQPYFRSPEEMDAQATARELAKDKAKRTAVTQGELEEAQTLAPQMGMTVEDFLKQRKGILNTSALKGQQSKKLGVLVTPDGRQVFAVDTFDPNTGQHRLTDEWGMDIPPGAQPPASGTSGYQQHLVQKPDGSYDIIYAAKSPTLGAGPAQGAGPLPTPPATGATPPKPGVVVQPTGVRGKLPQPPQGSIVKTTDADGNPIYARARGDSIKPITGPNNQPVRVYEPPEKMSAQGKQALVGINVVNAMIPGLRQDLQNLGLSNNPIGQNWDLMLAQHGFSPGEAEEHLLQTLGIADAYGLRGLMGGRPNQKLIDIVRVHLPQPGDSTQLSWDKLNTLEQQLKNIEAAIIKSESTRLPRAGQPEAAGSNPEQELLDYLKGKQ